MNSDIKVLYVEDNKATRDSFYSILKKRYFENVTCAVDGHEGLELFTKNDCDFDLVISDIMMPKLNGVSMLSQMKKLKPSLTSMFISGSDSVEQLINAIELGVDKFILKPINYPDLDNSLTTICKQIKATKKIDQFKAEAEVAIRLLDEYKKAVDESTIFSIVDLEGRIKYANKQFQEVSGYSLEELQAKPHSIVSHPEMPKTVFEQMWNTIQNKQIWKGIVKNKTKNADTYYVKATIVPILDDEGNIMEYASIGDDITELIKKEEELRELKDK